MVHLLSKLQDTAQDSNSQLSTVHRTSLHAIIAGILYLLGKISTISALGDHVQEIVEKRRENAPMLLPDGLFRREREELDGAVGRQSYPNHVEDELLFHLRERGLDRQSPDPGMDFRKGTVKESCVYVILRVYIYLSCILCIGHMMRESSTYSNDFQPHASLSLDYGADSPVNHHTHTPLSLSPSTPFLSQSILCVCVFSFLCSLVWNR